MAQSSDDECERESQCDSPIGQRQAYERRQRRLAQQQQQQQQQQGGAAAGAAAGTAAGSSAAGPSSNRNAGASPAGSALVAPRARGEPVACARLSTPRLQVCCLHCEAGGAPRSGECLAAAVQDTRWEVLVETLHERVEAFKDDAEQYAEARHTARFHLYKYFTQWQFQGEPLGSGKRAKLPDCFEWLARDTFKSPACCVGCDLLRGCETAGHYTGFRTAAESKAKGSKYRREGWSPLFEVRG